MKEMYGPLPRTFSELSHASLQAAFGSGDQQTYIPVPTQPLPPVQPQAIASVSHVPLLNGAIPSRNNMGKVPAVTCGGCGWQEDKDTSSNQRTYTHSHTNARPLILGREGPGEGLLPRPHYLTLSMGCSLLAPPRGENREALAR